MLDCLFHKKDGITGTEPFFLIIVFLRSDKITHASFCFTKPLAKTNDTHQYTIPALFQGHSCQKNGTSEQRLVFCYMWKNHSQKIYVRFSF